MRPRVHGSGAHTPAVWLQNHAAAPELYCWPEQAFWNLLDASSMWMHQRRRMWKVIPVSVGTSAEVCSAALGDSSPGLGAGSRHPSQPSITAPTSPLGPPRPAGLRPLSSTEGATGGVSPGDTSSAAIMSTWQGGPLTPTGLSKDSCRKKIHYSSTEGPLCGSQALAVLWEEGPASGNDTAQRAWPSKSPSSLPAPVPAATRGSGSAVPPCLMDPTQIWATPKPPKTGGFFGSIPATPPAPRLSLPLSLHPGSQNMSRSTGSPPPLPPAARPSASWSEHQPPAL